MWVKILVIKLEKFIMTKKVKKLFMEHNSEERKELEEEGIDLLSIPWVSKDN